MVAAVVGQSSLGEGGILQEREKVKPHSSLSVTHFRTKRKNELP